MVEMTRLNEVYPDWRGTNSKGGFFYYLNQYATDNDIEIPFISKWAVLDYEYHGNVSGNKFVSPLIENLLVDGVLPDSEALKIADMFWTIYKNDLMALWNLDNAEYNPLYNYDMHEDTDITKTINHTLSKLGTESDVRTGSMEEVNSVQGFDSSTYNPSDKTNTTYNSVTDTTSFDGRRDSNSGTDTDDTLSDKYGNIGTTTTQRLIEEERKVHEWNFYLNSLFKSADTILVLPVY